MHILPEMTEEKLENPLPKQRKRWRFRLIGAALLLLVALLVVFRQHVAGGIAQGICAGQNLTCRLTVSRLDFGGLTFKGLAIAGPKAQKPALSADRLAIDLTWDSLFSPRASMIGGDEITLRVDLSGARPILGDLDAAVKNFTKGPAKPGPMPQLDFKSLRVIGETPGGPVEARGQVVATGPDDFVIALNAAPSKLALYGAELDLAGAQLNAAVKGGAISAKAQLGLVTFKTANSDISDVRLDMSLEQSAGVLRGAGTASLGAVDLRNTKLASAEAKASVESAAVDPAALDFNAWVANVRKLSLNATAGPGAIEGIAWDKGMLTALIEPRADGGSGGDISFVADRVKLKPGSADQLRIDGRIDLPSGGRPSAQGTAAWIGGSLTAEQRDDLAKALSDPFMAALPTFGAAIARAAERAGQAFEIATPWSIAATESGFDISTRTAQIKSASGLLIKAAPASDRQESVTWSTANGGRWSAAGSLSLSGGGAPGVTIDLVRATGHGEDVSLAGAAKLASWRVGDDVLAAEATGLEFDTRSDGGGAAGQFTVRLDGGLGGGVWKDAEATGQVRAAWSKGAFYAEAPRGLVIQWKEGKYGGLTIGASALHYVPRGRLAEQSGKAIVGQGSLAKLVVPVTSEGYSAKASLGATAINWRAEGGMQIGFNAEPSTIDLNWAERTTPVTIQDVSGTLDLRDGWRVKGGFSGGEARAAEATISGLAGKFDIGGEGGDLNGAVSDVAMRIFDPLPEATRRYEEARFEGAATLLKSVATFTGQFTLARPAIQIASIRGAHSLKTGSGSLTFEPTPLIFVPRAFQPYHLSSLLRGPANVTGRADISGGASWSEDGVTSNATLDLRRIGFVLSTAGIFEGVNGKVEISDLLNMKSEPNQTITLDKVTLGLPIEKGAIHFQLIGYDAIRLEGAEWPFVGGSIRIKPIDFRFGDVENRIIAQAVNWDLNTIVEQFKVPDVKLSGTISGDIPVSFSTGSASIDNAQLEASNVGGKIQYTGSTGDAAAQADSNAKMLFDALKDFRYEVLKVGVNGDIADRIVLSMQLLGRNPTVLDGAQFKLGISIDSALMELLNTTQWRSRIGDAVTGAVVGAPN